MIKGVNHTIIEVTNPCNQYFERALLFVRPQAEQTKHQQLQKEADLFMELIGKPPVHNPIILENKRKQRKIKRMILHSFWWLVGLGCGYGIHLLF